jgi:hypothetical protein
VGEVVRHTGAVKKLYLQFRKFSLVLLVELMYKTGVNFYDGLRAAL